MNRILIALFLFGAFGLKLSAEPGHYSANYVLSKEDCNCDVIAGYDASKIKMHCDFVHDFQANSDKEAFSYFKKICENMKQTKINCECGLVVFWYNGTTEIKPLKNISCTPSDAIMMADWLSVKGEAGEIRCK